jgi:hypothetical protein
MDIRELKTHALKIFDSMASSITNESPHLGPPNDFAFLLGGYSWIAKRFFIWTIRYDVAVKGFVPWKRRRSHRMEKRKRSSTPVSND